MVGFSLETDPIRDAARELLALREALTHRHGDRFRELERRVEALFADKPETAELHDLGEGILITTPPKEWTDILAEGRALGVI